MKFCFQKKLIKFKKLSNFKNNIFNKMLLDKDKIKKFCNKKIKKIQKKYFFFKIENEIKTKNKNKIKISHKYFL